MLFVIERVIEFIFKRKTFRGIVLDSTKGYVKYMLPGTCDETMLVSRMPQRYCRSRACKALFDRNSADKAAIRASR